jgi:hypothetical protein
MKKKYDKENKKRMEEAKTKDERNRKKRINERSRKRLKDHR